MDQDFDQIDEAYEAEADVESGFLNFYPRSTDRSGQDLKLSNS